MVKRLHPLSAIAAMATIAGFWLSTVSVELFGATEDIVAVKTTIRALLPALILTLAATGASGMALGRRRVGALVARKRRRMPVIAANGLIILVPAALYLAWKADRGALDATFYAVQTLELAAGAVNLALLGASARDGLRMTGRLSRSRPAPRA